MIGFDGATLVPYSYHASAQNQPSLGFLVTFKGGAIWFLHCGKQMMQSAILALARLAESAALPCSGWKRMDKPTRRRCRLLSEQQEWTVYCSDEAVSWQHRRLFV